MPNMMNIGSRSGCKDFIRILEKVSIVFITCVLTSFPTYFYWTQSDVQTSLFHKFFNNQLRCTHQNSSDGHE